MCSTLYFKFTSESLRHFVAVCMRRIFVTILLPHRLSNLFGLGEWIKVDNFGRFEVWE